ncbi:MAG: penicillin-binding protein activator [Alphaproteobacteria bacterium]|nr:penicillin-binding protein activator [Alphaproteobacteria bacterium]
MIKKIFYLFTVLAVSGCTTLKQSDKDAFVTEPSVIKEENFGEATNFRVGMLLPLTGVAAKQGEGLRNAALMALEDVNNPNMLLQFYDTKSTASGARIAIENALNQKSQLIIGPLMAEEVKAISPKTNEKNIPVITFSTNSDVIGGDVYSLGLLVGEQVDRVVTYAAKNGRKNLALLVPDNSTGIAVAKASIISAEKNNMTVEKIAFYHPNTNDFSEILKALTDYDARSARAKSLKERLMAQAEKGDQNSAKVLARLKSIDSLGEVKFDTILVPESGYKLKSAVAMLGYYDVSAPKVKILGTTLWEGSQLNHEGNFIGSWYPVLSRSHNAYFIKKYSEIFSENPSSLYAFAYDAVALASAVANKGDQSLTSQITNPEGYIGINGVFRIFPDGSNQHSLDILEVRNAENAVIDAAPKRFDSISYTNLRDIKLDEDYRAPLILGKDVNEAQVMIYGTILPPENQHLSGGKESEAEIIKKALQKHKIYIP